MDKYLLFYSRGYTSGTYNASVEKWLKKNGSSSFSVYINKEKNLSVFKSSW